MEEPPGGLTRRPTAWFRFADSRRGRDTLSRMDHPRGAVAVVHVAQNTATDYGRDLATRSRAAAREINCKNFASCIDYP